MIILGIVRQDSLPLPTPKDGKGCGIYDLNTTNKLVVSSIRRLECDCSNDKAHLHTGFLPLGRGIPAPLEIFLLLGRSFLSLDRGVAASGQTTHGIGAEDNNMFSCLWSKSFLQYIMFVPSRSIPSPICAHTPPPTSLVVLETSICFYRLVVCAH